MRTLMQPLNMSPGDIPPVIHVSQYDSDFTIVFTLFSTVGDFTIESGTTAQIRGTKSSGTGYSADAAINISAKTVTITGDAQMTAAAGQNIFEIVLKKNNKEISSKNFILHVERAALDADTITDESVLKELNAIIEGAETATQAAEEAEDAADRAEAAAQTLVIDSTPTQGSAHAVSSGGVYDALQSAGLSEDVKTALLNCFKHVAWIDGHVQDYYDALKNALHANTDDDEEEYKYTWNYPSDTTLHSVLGFSSDNSDIYSANDHRSLYVDNGEANAQLLYTNGNLINNGSAFMIPIPPDATKVTVTISQSWKFAFSIWNYSNGRNSRAWMGDAGGWNTGTKTITFTAQENLALGLSYKLISGANIANQDVDAISIVFE